MLKGRVPIVIAAVFAVLAALVSYLAVQQKSAEIQSGWEPVPVMVALRDLRAGEALTKENLGVGKVPESIATESVIRVSDVKQGTVVFGQKLAMEMSRGDPLLFQHIKTSVGEQRLSDAVQKNGRAVSIRVSPESSVHHWVEPGDRVDVLGVFRDPRSRDLSTVTLLQNVIVLATGRIGGRTNRRVLTDNEKQYNTVTVHVLPEAAEMLVLAQDLGSLYLTLRNGEDNAIAELEQGKTTANTLFTGERSKRISRTQSKMFKVEIIRGKRASAQLVK